MSPETYRSLISRLGFKSIVDAGRWLGAGDRIARRWADDDVGLGPPPGIAKLLMFMVAMNMGPNEVDRAIAREGIEQ